MTGSKIGQSAAFSPPRKPAACDTCPSSRSLAAMHITVVGGGNSTPIFAALAADAGHTVSILTRRPEAWNKDDIGFVNEDLEYMPQTELRTKVALVTSDPALCIPQAELIFIAGLPIHHNPTVLRTIKPHMDMSRLGLGLGSGSGSGLALTLASPDPSPNPNAHQESLRRLDLRVWRLQLGGGRGARAGRLLPLRHANPNPNPQPNPSPQPDPNLSLTRALSLTLSLSLSLTLTLTLTQARSSSRGAAAPRSTAGSASSSAPSGCCGSPPRTAPTRTASSRSSRRSSRWFACS